MRTITSLYRFFPGVFLLLTVSCKKYLNVEPPVDQVTTAQAFADDASATTALRGLYAQMSSSNSFFFANGGMTFYTGLTGDELLNSKNSKSYAPYASDAIPATDFYLSNYLWLPAYKFIYEANAIIENTTASTAISAPVKAQLIGEAKFIRAFCHFYLLNCFGPIPLATTTSYEVTSSLTRSDSATVYKQIIQDLVDAVGILPEAYPTGDKGRVNKWAAQAFLNRVYLYTHDWNDASTGAAAVIGSGAYSMEALSNVYLTSSQEAIFQLLPAYFEDNTAEGYQFVPSSAMAKPAYSLSAVMMSAFDSGDQRRVEWVDSNIVAGSIYYYPYKYKTRLSTPASEYYVVLRLGEQYLILAEAQAQLGNISAAVQSLDVIRTRAGLVPLAQSNPGIDQADLFQAINHENQVEFFCEWGHRWFDLKRLGMIDAVLGTEKSSVWHPTAALFPIPNEEILANPNLTQNAGY